MDKWYKTYNSIMQRCKWNKSHKYFKKGIKNYLSIEDLKILWFRDKAYLMKKPSIDRLNSKGNYTLKNCRYIELRENSREGGMKNFKYRIKQYTLEGKFVKEWNSQTEISETLGLDVRQLSRCCRGERKKFHGFMWKRNGHRRDYLTNK
jgi:hypothetical protein